MIAPEEFKMKIQQTAIALTLYAMPKTYGPLDAAPLEVQTQGRFRARLTRYIAQLAAEGNTLFVIDTGTNTETERSEPWAGVWQENVAFAIRSRADYYAALEFFEPDEFAAWDLHRTYTPMFVVAPTSIIK